jgi:hypothetical protein
MAARIDFLIPAAILNFMNSFFSYKFCVLLIPKKIRKDDWKNLENSQSCAKQSDFDPPFWIDPQFLSNMTKYSLDLCCWRKYELVAKNRLHKWWKLSIWISSAILVGRHFEYVFNISSMQYIRGKHKLKSKKLNAKMVKTIYLLSKNQFFCHFENCRHFESEKTFQFF